MALNLFKSISNWLAAAAATGMKVKIAVLAFRRIPTAYSGQVDRRIQEYR